MVTLAIKDCIMTVRRTRQTVQNSVEYQEFHLIYDKPEVWGGLGITVQFRAGKDELYNVVGALPGMVYTVPWEALAAESFHVSAYGIGDGGNMLVTTTEQEVRILASGYQPKNSPPRDPSPDEFEQIMAAIGELSGRTVPLGGATGQVLTKVGDDDFDAEWKDNVTPKSDHSELTGRSAPNQHPISAITELDETLNNMQSVIDNLEAGGNGIADVKLGGTSVVANNIAQLPAYPTSLPANGGNAATVGGKPPADFATAAQGQKAETAVQPEGLAEVATSGDYNDLENRPAIPTAADDVGAIPISQKGTANGVASTDGNNKVMPAVLPVSTDEGNMLQVKADGVFVPAVSGAKGDPGAAATIAVGTVTTGPPGTNVSVTNAGNENAAVLNFTIPRGGDGAKGPPGPNQISASTEVSGIADGKFIGVENGRVVGKDAPSGGGSWGTITGPIESQADLMAKIESVKGPIQTIYSTEENPVDLALLGGGLYYIDGDGYVEFNGEWFGDVYNWDPRLMFLIVIVGEGGNYISQRYFNSVANAHLEFYQNVWSGGEIQRYVTSDDSGKIEYMEIGDIRTSNLELHGGFNIHSDIGDNASIHSEGGLEIVASDHHSLGNAGFGQGHISLGGYVHLNKVPVITEAYPSTVTHPLATQDYVDDAIAALQNQLDASGGGDIGDQTELDNQIKAYLDSAVKTAIEEIRNTIPEEESGLIFSGVSERVDSVHPVTGTPRCYLKLLSSGKLFVGENAMFDIWGIGGGGGGARGNVGGVSGGGGGGGGGYTNILRNYPSTAGGYIEVHLGGGGIGAVNTVGAQATPGEQTIVCDINGNPILVCPGGLQGKMNGTLGGDGGDGGSGGGVGGYAVVNYSYGSDGGSDGGDGGYFVPSDNTPRVSGIGQGTSTKPFGGDNAEFNVPLGAGGAGGSTSNAAGVNGGTGGVYGGGNGAGGGTGRPATAGAPNTGSGGGGGAGQNTHKGADGGSGVVYVRFGDWGE